MSMLLTFPLLAVSALGLELGIRFGEQEKKGSPSLFSLVAVFTSLAFFLQPE